MQRGPIHVPSYCLMSGSITAHNNHNNSYDNNNNNNNYNKACQLTVGQAASVHSTADEDWWRVACVA